MDKVLIEIQCPAASRSYDFWAPKTMKVARLLERAIREIEQYEDNAELFDTDRVNALFHIGRQTLLNPKLTVTEAGIASGDALILI